MENQSLPDVGETSPISELPHRAVPVTLLMNLASGARRLRRFNIRCLKAFEQGSGANAALQFRVSMRECFRGILTPSPDSAGATRDENTFGLGASSGAGGNHTRRPQPGAIPRRSSRQFG